MYQALYRKWRPRSFDDVVGQQHVTETLKRQIAGGRLSHAYLFVGSRGTGKTTCAKILARAANCEHPVNGNPCNECASCRGIESGAILDVEEMDAASNNSVENIRALREEAVFTPASVRKRVYIVDEVHMLSTAAFNALLKILEEPPEHLIFILATTEIQKVPATILSRCQRFSFKRITAEDIAGRLQYVAEKENMQLLPDAARLLGRLADGSMRDGLSLLDQCAGETIDTARVLSAIGLSGALETAKLLQAAVAGNTQEAITIFNRLYYDGKDVDSILKELLALCRDVLMTVVAPQGGESLLSGNFTQDILTDFAEKIRPQKLLLYSKRIQSALDAMAICGDRKIACELCLVELCDTSLLQDAAALSLRVSQLEEKFKNGEVMQTAAKPAAEKPAGYAEPKEEKASLSRSEETGPEKEEPVFEPVPGPSEKQAVLAASGEDVWEKILKAIQDKIDIPAYMFLSDKTHAVARIGEGFLEIQAKSVIAKNMLDTTPVTIALKETAEGILKRPVQVRITEYSGEKPLNQDKLDALKRFHNIKFE